MTQKDRRWRILIVSLCSLQFGLWYWSVPKSISSIKLKPKEKKSIKSNENMLKERSSKWFPFFIWFQHLAAAGAPEGQQTVKHMALCHSCVRVRVHARKLPGTTKHVRGETGDNFVVPLQYWHSLTPLLRVGQGVCTIPLLLSCLTRACGCLHEHCRCIPTLTIHTCPSGFSRRAWVSTRETTLIM